MFTIVFAAVAISTLLLTLLAESILIPILRKLKVGQRVLEVGPNWHKKKEGTPTMGGIGFILAVLVVMAVFFIIKGVQGISASYIPLSLTLAFAVANASIGVLDDWCKLRKKENEGLTRTQKLLLQLAVAAAYVCIMSYTGNLTTALELPLTNAVWELEWFAYPLYVLILVGVVNGSNFTDGLDGLESSVTFVIGGFFALLGFYWLEEQIAVLGALILGATLGFWFFNHYPAKVFMGDTGSLFLGGLVIGAVFQTGEIFIGLILCAVYVIEMLSSFLQIGYYKLTKDKTTGIGKKLFRMAPLHHHFEKCGWKETNVVLAFSIAQIVMCLFAWLVL